MKSIDLTHQPASQRVRVLCLSRLLCSCGRSQESSLWFWPTPANGHSGLAAVACWPPHPEPLTLICTHGPTKLPRTTIRFVRPSTNVPYLVNNCVRHKWRNQSGATTERHHLPCRSTQCLQNRLHAAAAQQPNLRKQPAHFSAWPTHLCVSPRFTDTSALEAQLAKQTNTALGL